jgi:hypothetical protein
MTLLTMTKEIWTMAGMMREMSKNKTKSNVMAENVIAGAQMQHLVTRNWVPLFIILAHPPLIHPVSKHFVARWHHLWLRPCPSKQFMKQLKFLSAPLETEMDGMRIIADWMVTWQLFQAPLQEVPRATQLQNA